MNWRLEIIKLVSRSFIPKPAQIDSLDFFRARLDHFSRYIKISPEIKTKPDVICGLPCVWFSSENCLEGRVILYLHGGGYGVCSTVSHRGLISNLVLEAKLPALGINYRLAPENPFPAAVMDAAHVYQWLLDQGYSADKIVIAGDSAGGGLTLATMIDAQTKEIPLPACGVLFSPWTDLGMTGGSIQLKAARDPLLTLGFTRYMAEQYIGENDPKHPLISPLYADLEGLPPLLIQVGSEEILLDDSTRLAARAQTAGVDAELEIWEGAFHVFQAFESIFPQAKNAIKKAGAYIQANVN